MQPASSSKWNIEHPILLANRNSDISDNNVCSKKRGVTVSTKLPKKQPAWPCRAAYTSDAACRTYLLPRWQQARCRGRIPPDSASLGPGLAERKGQTTRSPHPYPPGTRYHWSCSRRGGLTHLALKPLVARDRFFCSPGCKEEPKRHGL